MNARLRMAVALLLVAFALTSCRLFHKPKPLPPPLRLPPQIQKAPPPPPPLEPPPQVPASSPVQGPPGLPQEEPLALPPPPPEKKRPSPAGPRAPAPAEAPPPAAPAPQLRPVLTPAQQQELERSVGERIARARSVLASISRKRLTREQANMAEQIRTFLKQAEEARGTDLLRANNLAERAEVLAQDLANRLR